MSLCDVEGGARASADRETESTGTVRPDDRCGRSSDVMSWTGGEVMTTVDSVLRVFPVFAPQLRPQPLRHSLRPPSQPVQLRPSLHQSLATALVRPTHYIKPRSWAVSSPGFVTSALDLVAQRAEAESARCSVQGELVASRPCWGMLTAHAVEIRPSWCSKMQNRGHQSRIQEFDMCPPRVKVITGTPVASSKTSSTCMDS